MKASARVCFSLALFGVLVNDVRPDTFAVSQLYAIIVLPNGGPDLEAYTFSTPVKSGWRQACSIFWQVTRALAKAEERVSFEVCSFSRLANIIADLWAP